MLPNDKENSGAQRLDDEAPLYQPLLPVEEKEEKTDGANQEEFNTDLALEVVPTLEEKLEILADVRAGLEKVMSSGRVRCGIIFWTLAFFMTLPSAIALTYFAAETDNSSETDWYALLAVLLYLAALGSGHETSYLCFPKTYKKVINKTDSDIAHAIRNHPTYSALEKTAKNLAPAIGETNPLALRAELKIAERAIRQEIDIRQAQRLAFLSGSYIKSESKHNPLSSIQNFFKRLDNRKNGARDVICTNIFKFADVHKEKANKPRLK